MAINTEPDASRHTAGRGAPVWWGVLGLLVAFGIASLLTIGVFVLAAALLVGIAMAVRRVGLRSAPAFFIGVSLVPVYLAILNIRGPGTVCDRTPTSVTCEDLYSPWPFVIAAMVFLLLGVGLLLALRRR